MKMITYFVAVTEGEKNLKKRLNQSYDDVYEYADKFFLLRTEDNLSTVMRTLGLKDDPADSDAAVFEVKGRFGGYSDLALWDWMKITEYQTYA